MSLYLPAGLPPEDGILQAARADATMARKRFIANCLKDGVHPRDAWIAVCKREGCDPGNMKWLKHYR